ncbi:MAG: DUF4430 domain-containing protein [Pseudomonadota bacterium]
MRRLAALLAVVLLAACGGGEDGGRATIWVTRDSGATVLHEERVPAGESVLRALDRVADVETRYGGRFVQAVDGLEGSAARGDDWFFYVNGYLADRGAAEYRLRPGDVAWWDYRSWDPADEEADRVVVGAFPEPFVHGYDGRVREAVVTYAEPSQEAAARRLADHVRGRVIRGAPPEGANVLALVAGPTRAAASVRGGGTGPVRFELAGAAPDRLAADPSAYARRYRVP